MSLPTDFELMQAEGRIIELADQIGRNAGHIDFLKGNPFSTEIEKWHQELKPMLGTLNSVLVVNVWEVFEVGYREGLGVDRELESIEND